MNFLKVTLGFLLVTIIMSFTYPSSFVEMSSVNYDGWEFKSMILKRGASGRKIKAKYFAAKVNGTNIPTRYENWSYNKNIIAYMSGSYATGWGSSAKPVGITVDNGKIINISIALSDGLIVVYNIGPSAGGIVTAHIDKGITVGGINKRLYVKNPSDRLQFLNWCEQNNATVFQTHLLVFNGELQFGSNSSAKLQDRRFLAVGKNDDGELQYVVVSSPKITSLYDGAKKTLDYLINYEDMEVTFMINLDTGGKNILKCYNGDGSVNSTMKGSQPIEIANNILAFYYQ